jgi:hypothetical protein
MRRIHPPFLRFVLRKPKREWGAQVVVGHIMSLSERQKKDVSSWERLWTLPSNIPPTKTRDEIMRLPLLKECRRCGAAERRCWVCGVERSFTSTWRLEMFLRKPKKASKARAMRAHAFGKLFKVCKLSFKKMNSKESPSEVKRGQERPTTRIVDLAHGREIGRVIVQGWEIGHIIDQDQETEIIDQEIESIDQETRNMTREIGDMDIDRRRR